MEKTLKQIWLITFLITANIGALNAQLVADFTMNKSSGCPTLRVEFYNDTTTHGDTISYHWDFGDGNTSVLTNPVHNFTISNTYSVQLILKNLAKTINYDTIEKNVTVFNPPTADFTSNVTLGCVPLNVQFQDISTQGDAAITSWDWVMGDGFSYNTQNPNHTYFRSSNPLPYIVSLTIVDANGCGSVKNNSNYDVVDPPQVIITSDPIISCDAPVSVKFISNSTGPDAQSLQYSWTFGDGGTASIEEPIHEYGSFGIYYPELTITSGKYGCSDTDSTAVNVNNVSATGTLKQNGELINDGDTICPSPIHYESEVPGGLVEWNFESGITNLTEGDFGKISPGNRTYTLIAAPLTQCADTTEWNIYVRPINVDFLINDTLVNTYNSCKSPDTAFFKIHPETKYVSSSWDFELGKYQTTGDSVSYVVTAPPDTNPYASSAEYDATIVLTITTKEGCESSKTKFYKIKKPTAKFRVDTASGCAPLTVLCRNNSSSLAMDSIFAGMEWVFDDGTTEFVQGESDSIEHTFNTPGEYEVRTVLTNNLRCTDTSFPILIRVGDEITPNFSMSKSSVCINETLTFQDLSGNSDIDNWQYFIDDIPISKNFENPNVTWKAKAKPGSRDVTQVVDYNGCFSTSAPKTLTITGPLANFTYATNCNTPLNYTFTNTTDNGAAYNWFFDPGTSTATNPTHSFAGDSDYNVRLVAESDGCSDTITRTVKVRNSSAVITSDTSACINTDIYFNGSNSFTTPTIGCSEPYIWDFGDNTNPIRSIFDSVPKRYTEAGTYVVKLVVEYDNGCTDTTTHTINLEGPDAEFSVDTTQGCSPFSVEFTDLSTQGKAPISSYKYNFDDGSDTSFVNYTGSFSHLFKQQTGSFEVLLSVTDADGCVGLDTQLIKTSNPNAEFTVNPFKFCIYDSITLEFDTLDNPYDSLIWDFGDGTTIRNNVSEIKYAYSESPASPASLTLFRFGCASTHKGDSLNYILDRADADFELVSSGYLCYNNLEFNHLFELDVDTILSEWRLPGSNQEVLPYRKNPVFNNYTAPGTYNVELFVQTKLGCKDSANMDITLVGPTADVTVNPDTACQHEPVTFTIGNIVGASSYTWEMGDGTEIENQSTVQHSFSGIGTLVPFVKLTDENNDQCEPLVPAPVYIHEVQAAFSAVDSSLCTNTNVIFENKSLGQDTHLWEFGNGLSSTDSIPTTVYTNAGDYNISLAVSNFELGCADTFTFKVNVKPRPSLTITDDTAFCGSSDTLLLTAQGGDLINWWSDAFIESPNDYSTRVYNTNTAKYYVSVKDTTTGCWHPDSIAVVVERDPGLMLTPAFDTMIFIGDSVILSTDSIPGYTYSWKCSPNVDPNCWLTCSNCPTVIAKPEGSVEYQLEAKDTNNCYPTSFVLNIIVKDEFKIVMPNAFTPTKEENNVYKINHWGISELKEFSIYNRWGNIVFSTDDLDEGWDGTYKDVMQNTDTYVYVIRAVMYDGKEKTEKGSFLLLK
ncbi:MAG: PKD domain-containing protein [Bacteroidales bacterium]|nr:PKD domain-containing protein [Bacteroidales bacterium]